MKNKVNKKKFTLKQFFINESSYLGADSFQGGPFGFGGTSQLAKIDPAVNKIRQAEEGEVNQNIVDQNWTMGKNNWEKHLNLQDIYTDNSQGERDRPLNRVSEERNAADTNYTHLRGTPVNSLDNQKLHVPGAGRPDGTDEYLFDDDIIPHDFAEPAEESPLGGMGQVIAPKQFIPKDQPEVQTEIKNNKKSSLRDEKYQTSVKKNIKNIKKYLQFFKSAATKPNERNTLATKIDIELKDLENLISTIIEEEIKGTK